MMKKKNAFTLAEVLIALTIIGVIAAMTIPTLINNTNAQEFRTGLKKAIAVLNQAITMHYALEGETAADITDIAAVMQKRLNVITTVSPITSDTSKAWGGSGTVMIYTADGIAYSFTANSCNSASTDDTVCYTVYIDVNGDRRPNTATPTTGKLKDGYTAAMYPQRVVPTGTAQQVMYDQGLYYNSGGS